MYRVISNIIWIIFGGIWLALIWSVFGIILCITIVGIPFGVQCFKLAAFSFLPKRKNFRKRSWKKSYAPYKRANNNKPPGP